MVGVPCGRGLCSQPPPLAPPTNSPTGDKETLIQKRILSQLLERAEVWRRGKGGRLTGAVNHKYINTYIISIHTHSNVVMAVPAGKQVTFKKKIRTNNKIKYFPLPERSTKQGFGLEFSVSRGGSK